MSHQELQIQALNEPQVFWGNTRCIRVQTVNGNVDFTAWHGGFTYRTSQEQWSSGQLTEVH